MFSTLTTYATVIADLDAHPDKRVFWRSGLAFRGAEEYEFKRTSEGYPKTRQVCEDLRMKTVTWNTWKDELRWRFNAACCVDCRRNTDEEIHLNSYSSNDMY